MKINESGYFRFMNEEFEEGSKGTGIPSELL